MRAFIYTLELEHGKIYVGRSLLPDKRILQHFQNTSGCEWTKLHRPLRVISQLRGDEFDEEKYTLIAMEKYGVDNVRGGSYCKVVLSQSEKKKAIQTIRSIGDRCYKCGEKGHYAKYCAMPMPGRANTNIPSRPAGTPPRPAGTPTRPAGTPPRPAGTPPRPASPPNMPWWIDMLCKNNFDIDATCAEFASTAPTYSIEDCLKNVIHYGITGEETPQFHTMKTEIHHLGFSLVNSLFGNR